MDTPSGILSVEAESMIYLKSSIGSLMADWFGIDVVTAPELDPTKADVHLMTEYGITSHRSLEDKVRACSSSRLKSSRNVIVIVLCTTTPQCSNIVIDKGFQVFYVQQPYV
jgi:hypothetical protein